MLRSSRSGYAAAVACCLSAGSAAPADWAANGFFSQNFSVNAGDFFEDGEEFIEDTFLQSTTDVGVSISGRTPRASWSFSPGLRASVSTAEEENRSFTDVVRPRFNGAFSYAGPRYGLSAGLSLVPDFTNETQFEDTGIVERDVLQITAAGNLGFRYTVDQRNSLSLSGAATFRTFTGPTETLEDTRTYSLSGGWSHAATPRTSLSLGSSWSYSPRLSQSGTSAQTVSMTIGANHRLNSRTGLSATLGPAVSFLSTRTAAAGGGFVEEDTVDGSVVGSLGFSYSGLRSSVSFNVNQNVDQNSEGQIVNRTSLSASYGYTLTSRSRISIGSTLGSQTPLLADADRQTLSVTPTYSFQVNQDWSLQAGYRLRAERREGDVGVSNFVFLGVSRGLTFLP